MMGNKEYTVGLFFLDAEYGESGAYPNKGAIEVGPDFSPVWGTWFTQLSTQAQQLGALAAAGTCYTCTISCTSGTPSSSSRRWWFLCNNRGWRYDCSRYDMV